MDEAALADLLRRHAERHHVPGAALGLLRGGEMTAACWGVADEATRERVTPETRFAIGSLTKSMVATVLARLAATGRVSLDDPVTRHVPEVGAARWARDVTLRDLMANRSGLPLSAALEFGFDRRTGRDDDALSRLVADIPATPERGRFWSYSNVGWCVLGRAVETALDTSWEEGMRTVLASLGLTATVFTAAPGDSRAHAPAGTTTTSTVGDLLLLAAAHLDRPELAPLREMHSDLAVHGWLDGWGLGWARFDWGGETAWGWDGLIATSRSVLRLLPDRHSAVVLLTDAASGRAMYRSLFAELVPSAFGVRFPTLTLDAVHAAPDAASGLSRYAGVYAWPDRRFEVSADTDRLRITTEDGALEARPIDERTFLLDAQDPDVPTMTFGSFDETGRPQVLYDMIWAIPRIAG